MHEIAALRQQLSILKRRNERIESELAEWQALGRELIAALSVTRSDDWIFIETIESVFGQVDDVGYWEDSDNPKNKRVHQALDKLLHLSRG